MIGTNGDEYIGGERCFVIVWCSPLSIVLKFALLLHEISFINQIADLLLIFHTCYLLIIKNVELII